MTLAWIIGATAAGGLLSVLLAAAASLTVLLRASTRLIGFAVGVLLAAALVELIPDAAAHLPAREVGLTVLGAVLGFFVLEKLALWRHAHVGTPGAVARERHPSGAMVLVGDGVHNFCDGVLVAAAFLQDHTVGVAVAVAVLAHEVPQELGDFAVLLSAGYSRREALALNALSGGAAVLGGIAGYAALQEAEGALPYALAVAAASFLYIAVADLIPLMQRKCEPRDLATQLALILAGVGVTIV